MFTFPFVLLTIPNAFFRVARKGMFVMSSGTIDTFPQKVPSIWISRILFYEPREKIIRFKEKGLWIVLKLWLSYHEWINHLRIILIRRHWLRRRWHWMQSPIARRRCSVGNIITERERTGKRATEWWVTLSRLKSENILSILHSCECLGELKLLSCASMAALDLIEMCFSSRNSFHISCTDSWTF
jgi:hypothetical protein